MTRAVVLLTDERQAGLVAVASAVADAVTVFAVAASEASDAFVGTGVRRVVHVLPADGVPPEGCAAAVAELVAETDPDLVVAGREPADRVLAGYLAGRLRTPIVGDAVRLERRDGALVVTRAMLGGIVESDERADGPLVVTLQPPADAPAPDEPSTRPIVETVSGGSGTMRIVEGTDGEPVVELAAARRIVAVGRGLTRAEDLKLVERLAEALDAEVGCSRPLAQGLGWLPDDRTIGVSGRRVAPELYVAIGISGQLQHVAGVRGAGTIVAINTDPLAPLVRDCDYAIVGDLYEVVPSLLRALRH